MAGYPGTIAATWQRAGRAGRRDGAIGGGAGRVERADRPVRRPASRRISSTRSPEHALDQPRQPAHPARPREVRGVRAAVHGRRAFGAGERAGGARACCEERLRAFRREADGQWHWTQRVVSGRRRQPAVGFVGQLRRRRSRRTARDVIGETDFTSGPRRCTRRPSTSSKGSSSRSSGSTSTAARRTSATVDCDYYTDAITYTKVTILDRVRRRTRPTGAALHGEVHVVSRVVGFKKIKFYTNENVGSGELDLPEQQMHTTSYWLTIPPA